MDWGTILGAVRQSLTDGSVETYAAAAVASVALITDVRYRRIPNWLTGGSLVLGFGLNGALGGLHGLAMTLFGACLGLSVLFPFYLLRVMGAGDVKLLAGLGALVGPRALVSVVIFSALAGGVIAAIMLARRGRLLLTLRSMLLRQSPPSLSGATAPYAVAIAAGTYLSLVLPPVLS
ncbi:MAG: prepilin peptidase [Chloroflexi bacterium]|nr:prepilin peptidase [Chloroflexota bacterium]